MGGDGFPARSPAACGAARTARQRLASVICVLFTLFFVLALTSCAQTEGAGDKAADASGGTAASQSGEAAADDNASSPGAADQSEPGQAPAENAPAQGQDAGGQSGGAPGAEPSISLIGDSVPLGAVTQIEEALPGIDLLVRTDRDLAGPGIELLKQENAEGKLGDIVVLALGTSDLTRENIENAIEVIGPDKQIVFVNAYRGGASYIKEVNAAIAEAAAAHESNFTVADWYGYVESHPDIELAEDNCHLTESSAPDYAGVIKVGVDEAKEKAGA
jgi:hypothetical protein